MKWFKISGHKDTPKTLPNQNVVLMSKMIVDAYRSLGTKQGHAPTSITTDQKIIEIYRKVNIAFKEASKKRGEQIPAPVLNFLVWQFFQVYESLGKGNSDLGDLMLDSHLEYETQTYLESGLKPEQRQELKLY